MKLKVKPEGIANHANGFMPPRPGEGLYICRKCGERFSIRKSPCFFSIIGLARVRCPECGSFNTTRDPMVVY
jgi:DNA-directed RNA polymerase subunit RPC12/RpoP